MSAWHRVCLQVCVLPEAVVSPLGIEPCQWAAASKPGNNRNRAHLLLHSGFFFLYFVWFFFSMFTAPPGYPEFTCEFFFAWSLQLLQDTHPWPQSLRETMNNSTAGLLEILLWASCCGAGLGSILQPADPRLQTFDKSQALCGGGGVGGAEFSAFSLQLTENGWVQRLRVGWLEKKNVSLC